MTTYLFKCDRCSCPKAHTKYVLAYTQDEALCDHCDGRLIRDYRGEAVSPARVPGGGREHRS